MKWSTDYNSLNAGFFFLWEQMLLQPFKVIVGAVNVVLPRSSQLQMQQSRQHGCLVTRQLFNPQIRLASGSRQLFCLTFSDTIRKVSTSPSFTTSVTFTLWPWTLRADPTAFTSSWNHTVINWCDGKSPLTSHCMQWKLVTWHTQACQTKNSPSFSGFYSIPSVLYLLPSGFKSPFILIWATIVWSSKDPLPCVFYSAFMLQLLSLHRISSRSKCTFFLE